MFELKRLSKPGIAAALEKAMRYRLLNESGESESICHDVLACEPDNQEALVLLLLAQTDRFGKNFGVGSVSAQQVLPRLHDPYERAYYAGIICERKAKALLQRGSPGCEVEAYEALRDAMTYFEDAEAIRSPGNDDPILRWNACARFIMRNKLAPRSEENVPLMTE